MSAFALLVTKRWSEGAGGAGAPRRPTERPRTPADLAAVFGRRAALDVLAR